ncbi:TerB family tellurite resistance protein [Amaricoccus macauensis]|uniref:tellurite resistance TerB family protein n=1 Tax=Amaricoccus macauensis TaxID=57001 RepID=UPI003C7BF68E
MIADLIKRLVGETEPEPLPQDQARLALAALMVRVARTDGVYSSEERQRIDRVLSETYGLSASEATALRTDGERAEADAPDTVRFTRVIKDAVPYEHRNSVVEALWRVAAADGINADEHGLLRLVANLLGVSDQDSGLARQKALKLYGE